MGPSIEPKVKNSTVKPRIALNESGIQKIWCGEPRFRHQDVEILLYEGTWQELITGIQKVLSEPPKRLFVAGGLCSACFKNNGDNIKPKETSEMGATERNGVCFRRARCQQQREMGCACLQIVTISDHHPLEEILAHRTTTRSKK